MVFSEKRTLRRKLQNARESGKLQDISDCCCHLAAYLSDEEDHEGALKLYKESLTCCEKLMNKVGAALANRMIAEECTNLGYFDEALKHVLVFLKYAEEEKNKVEEQRGYVLKGHVYFTQAEYLMDAKPRESKKVQQLLELSMEAYRKSFSICHLELNNINEKERQQMKARLLQNISLVLSRQNKLDGAQTHLLRAIKICTKEKLNETEHICYLSLGDLYIKMGEHEKALSVFNKAFEMSNSTLKKRDSLVGKARTFISMENFRQAKSVLKKAYRLRANDEIEKLIRQVAAIINLENNLCSTPDSELNVRKNIYKKLGDKCCFLKHHKKGIKYYQNMLGCAQKTEDKNDIIKSYFRLCKAFTVDKQYDKALFYSHQVLDVASKWDWGRSHKIYLMIAELHELNESEFEEIHCSYKRVIDKIENPKHKMKYLKRLIEICQNNNNLDLMKKHKKELEEIKSKNEKGEDSSCDSLSESDSESSSESENSTDSSSPDIVHLLSDSDIENEEYDRPKERCKRTQFRIRRNEKGETNLHVACIKGNYKRVKQLLDQGHPANVRDTAGWTPLHEACNHGHVDIVNILLDFGADIDDRGGHSCEGTTPLHDAAINGQFKVIEVLIRRGASTLVLNDAGETPLQCLLAWKRSTVLDAEEAAIFDKIVESLKSPLDSANIRRHLKPNKSPKEIKADESEKNNSVKNKCQVSANEKRKPEKSAVLEYKETIQQLRGKRRTSHLDSDESQSENSDDSSSGSFKRKARKKTPEVKSKPALIKEEEYVDNCIMDDDWEDEFEEAMKNTEVCTPPRKKIKRPEKKLSYEDKTNANNHSPKKQENAKSPVPCESKSESPTSKPSLDITVNLLNEKIKISVDEFEISKLQVYWLIEEVYKTQPNIKDPDNFVYIKDGSDFIWETEPLSRIAGKEVDCVVTRWRILTLSKRYENACTLMSHPDISTIGPRAFGFKHTVDPHIADTLKKLSQTRRLTLSDLKLSALNLIPICKAIKYETYIQNLNLRNNYFGDKGLEIISKIFSNCLVEELDISGCLVTSAGVYYFNEALKDVEELVKNALVHLDLSYNPITNDAATSLREIIHQLPNLRTLKIDHCEVTTIIKSDNSRDLNIIQGEHFQSQRFEI